MSEFVKVHANERIDKEDFQDLSLQGRTALQKLVRSIFTGEGKARLLGNWDVALSNDLVTISLGSALVSDKTGGTVNYGQLLTDGDVQRSISVTSLGDATYKVWVRYTLQDKTAEARVFWDSNTNAEFLESVPTKKVDNWNAVVRNSTAGAPGPEWLEIYSFDRLTNVNSNGQSLGHYLFEGVSPVFNNLEWGNGVNDRNADRFTYGIKDLGTWVDAVRRQLGGLISDGGSWFDVVNAGGVNDMLRTDGSRTANKIVFTTPKPYRYLVNGASGISAVRDINPAGTGSGVPNPDPALNLTRMPGLLGDVPDGAVFGNAVYKTVFNLPMFTKFGEPIPADQIGLYKIVGWGITARALNNTNATYVCKLKRRQVADVSGAVGSGILEDPYGAMNLKTGSGVVGGGVLTTTAKLFIATGFFDGNVHNNGYYIEIENTVPATQSHLEIYSAFIELEILDFQD